jgi:UDP-N-acetylglucosamine 1-carboxyvinyltransferase
MATAAISSFNSPFPTQPLENVETPKPHFHSLSNPLPLLSQNPNQKLRITGPSRLYGHVPISGSKNSALSILAATLCCSGTCKLNNVPNVSDTRTMASILTSLGAQIHVSNSQFLVNTDGIHSLEPCSDSIRKIRGGFFVIGPLLARFGEASVALPGGCDIGVRPVDLYIRGLRALGAVVHFR